MIGQIWQGRLGGIRLILILAVAMLLVIGLASIWSTGKSNLFEKQLYWIALGVAAFVGVNLFPYRLLGRVGYGLYGLTLVLLVFILVSKYFIPMSFVPMRGGAYRWIQFHGSLQFQPSEIAKVTYILALAWYLRHRENYRTGWGLMGPFALTLVPMAFIIKQPDLGTVLLFLPVLFAVLFAAGAKVRHLLIIIGVSVLVSPLFYLTLRDYQKERIQGILYQNTDDPYWLSGPGYQLYQSKICIGSGGITGNGWGKGIYVEYRPFLPDRHNDFIFAMICHQWGFAGGIVVLVLYGVIIIGGIEIAASQNEPFGRLLAVGISALLGAQMFINIGMTMGLMPVTGMTLPFISYGGSSLLCNFLALGILVNVARHRPHQIANRAFEFDG